jgi:CDP-glycerol glycerophosphotransferase (TagB/SpsB family)
MQVIYVLFKIQFIFPIKKKTVRIKCVGSNKKNLQEFRFHQRQ